MATAAAATPGPDGLPHGERTTPESRVNPREGNFVTDTDDHGIQPTRYPVTTHGFPFIIISYPVFLIDLTASPHIFTPRSWIHDASSP
jgi:hypothetical protein